MSEEEVRDVLARPLEDRPGREGSRVADAAPVRAGAHAPQDNIQGGVKYLRKMLDRYDGNLAFAVAAYNAGPARVDEAGGVPDIAETREYLAKVLRYRLGYLREGAGVRQARR